MTFALKPNKVLAVLPQLLMQAVKHFLVWEVMIYGPQSKFTILWSTGRTIVRF
jgi:hypothetical protein